MNIQASDISESDAFSEYFELDFLNGCLKKLHKYAKKHFNRFCTLLVAITAILGWLIRGYGYAYQSAKLSVYNIDNSYIALNDNFFLEVMKYIGFGIGYLLINYIYCWVYFANKKDTGKFHFMRKMRIFFLFVIEGIAILVLVIIQGNYNILDFLNEMRGYNTITLLVYSILLFVTAVLYNLLGIHIVFSAKRRRKDMEDVTTNMPKLTISNKYISFIMGVSVILAIPLLFFGASGLLMEKQRTSFKVIPEQIVEAQSNDDLMDRTTFRLIDNNQYSLYAAVFENEEVYILCQLSKSEGEISLDRDCQKIVSKDGLITYNVKNIFQITYIE